MKLINLTATTDALELKLAWNVTATQLDWTCSYYDITTATWAVLEGVYTWTSNNTTAVTICAAPAAGHIRTIKGITVYNADTATAIPIVQFNANWTIRVVIRNSLTTLASWSAEDMSFYTDISGKVDKATYNAQTILQATTDDTPVALTVWEQTVVGRATGGNIVALAIDSDLSSVSASDDTVPSAKATKAMGDLKLPLAWGTMTGKVIQAGKTEVGKTYTPATGAQTVALDCSVNNVHIVSGHASGTAITFTITWCTDAQPFIVSILQGWTTVSTITAWFATVRRAWGTAPTLTATLNKRDTFWFIRTWADTYDGFIVWQNC